MNIVKIVQTEIHFEWDIFSIGGNTELQIVIWEFCFIMECVLAKHLPSIKSTTKVSVDWGMSRKTLSTGYMRW